MNGEGILYLGDFSSVDRDFLPLINAIEEIDIRLDFFGRGKNKNITKNPSKFKIFERRPLSEIYQVIPNYKILLIVLNRNGFQVPGKLYDFKQAPFKVLILYEDYLNIELLPKLNNYIYCRNSAPQIRAALDELL